MKSDDKQQPMTFCIICKNDLLESDAYLGLMPDGNNYYVCDSCKEFTIDPVKV